MTQTILTQKNYNGYQVDFVSYSADNVMVNATAMAKIFNKKVEPFVRNETTQNFIKECLKSENYSFLGLDKKQDLIDSRQKSGTYMHRILALKFAAWLDPSFELWIFATIDKIINEHHRELQNVLQTKQYLKVQKERAKEKLKQKIIEFPEIASYFDIEELQKQTHSKHLKILKRQHELIDRSLNGCLQHQD